VPEPGGDGEDAGLERVGGPVGPERVRVGEPVGHARGQTRAAHEPVGALAQEPWRVRISRLWLPGVPREGERIRAGDAGPYFSVDTILWDEGSVMLLLGCALEHEYPLTDLIRRGWEERAAWSSPSASHRMHSETQASG
jgi:hypothetical protein